MRDNKLVLVLTGVVFLCGCVMSRNEKSTDRSSLYEEAYQHIQSSGATENFLRDIEGVHHPYRFAVSDTVVFMELTSFFDYFRNKNTKEEDATVLDSLMKQDSTASFAAYRKKALSELGVAESPLVLFFSKPRDELLLAELFYASDPSESYDQVATLNTGLMFMMFIEGGRIRNSVTTTVEYN